MNDAPPGGDESPRPFRSRLSLGEIVLSAAGLDGAAREDFLCSVAADDPDLATAARNRLAASSDLADSFLAMPAAARLGAVPVDPEASVSAVSLLPGERYELGETLGEGGMGRVQDAFDHQLGRRVALKFLTHEDPAILRWFLREARAQARVQHEHVLEIYDSGELDGQPYIAMRRVDGGTLAEVGPTLSLERKVRLLVQVAKGLHAAHREGLLHRDVKPSNILVDQTDDGELNALVTDFGLATELATEFATEFATGLGCEESVTADVIAGSPHYIAPERLQSPPTSVDRRSDIYSLGVTMYWLFTGDLPFEGSNPVDVLRQVTYRDPPLPRTRMPTLPVELEAIILRCIARAPDQRYASARAVAADLERYLDGEVVEAYAASLAYRLTRFVLRNKLLAAMATVAVAALLVASVAVTVFALRADAARDRAELRHGQAEELLNFMVVDLHQKLSSLGRLDVLDDVGGAAMEYFAAVPVGDLSEAELLRRSRMLYQIGEVRIQQGDLEGAAAPMEESLALARRLVELEPDHGERLFELGQSHFWVGFVRWERGALDAARGPFMAYLEVSRRLVEMDSANLEWRRELSYAHSNLGSLLEAEGYLNGALEQFRATLKIDEELVAADPASATAQSELAATYNTLGIVLQALGRLGEAGEHLRADLGIRQTLVAADPSSFRARELLGASHGHLGIQLFMQGELQEAGEHFERMRAISDQLVAHDPANTSWRYQLAWSHLDLGRVAFARGDLPIAHAAWRRQEGMIDALLLLDPTAHRWQRTRATGLLHLALLKNARGDATAGNTVRTAIDILEALAVARPTDRQVHRWLSRSLVLLGTLEGTHTGAVAAFTRAAETIEPFVHGARDGRVLKPWAEALHCLGRFDEARDVVESLRSWGYVEPGMGATCGESLTSMSSVSRVLRLKS